MPLIPQNYTRATKIFLTCLIFLGIVAFTGFPGMSGAQVASAPAQQNPCPGADGISEGIFGTSAGGGLHVPVKDFDAEASLDAIESSTANIQKTSAQTAYYLKQLCEKEFNYDPATQNAWVAIVGQYVGLVINWINNAYGAGNPIYATNPHVYYRNVDLGVSQAMIRDIQESDIDETIKRIMIRTLELQQIDKVFPDYIAKQFSGTNEEVWEAPDDFSWDAWIEGSMGTGNNVYDLASLVQGEYEARRQTALDVEREKLAWGQGFFPVEVCGQQVFSEDSADIRTCKTQTPGSLIKDLSAVVLSSALRQMENADELGEEISGRALYAMSSAFWSQGINFPIPIPGAYQQPLSPQEAQGALSDIKQQDDFLKTQDELLGLTSKEKSGVYFGESLPEE